MTVTELIALLESFPEKARQVNVTGCCQHCWMNVYGLVKGEDDLNDESGADTVVIVTKAPPA